MIFLKYDVVTAVQCGYTDNPDQVMREQGYSWFSVIYTQTVNFYEVEIILHTLPPFLEASDIVDGRFDPRTTEKRIVPDTIDLGDMTIHFHQDPMVFMTVDFGPKGSKSSSIEDEEKERDRAIGEKAKRSAITKK